MGFLIKAAFWLVILILLVPTDSQQQNKVYGTAEAALKDVASFCDRNPETCVAGENAFGVLVQKAEFGARMLMDFVEGRTATASIENSEVMPIDAEVSADRIEPMPDDSEVMPLQPTLWETDASQDTLSSEDREAAWGG